MPRALLPLLLLIAALQGCASKPHSFAFAFPAGSSLELAKTVSIVTNEIGEAADSERTTTVVHVHVIKGGVLGKDPITTQVRLVQIIGSETLAGESTVRWDSKSGEAAGDDFETYERMLGLTYRATIAPDRTVTVDKVVWPSAPPGQEVSEIVTTVMSPEALAGELESVLSAVPSGAHRVGESWAMRTTSLSAFSSAPIELTAQCRFVALRDGIAELALEFDELPLTLPIKFTTRTGAQRFDVGKQMPHEQTYKVDAEVTLGDSTRAVKADVAIQFRWLEPGQAI